jgi:translocation protein SEC63
MSSFSDNFTRDENQDTQYDDSAFYTFAGTVLLVSIIPLVYFIYKRIFFSKELTKKNYKNCQCNNCKTRLDRHYQKIKKNNINFTFYFMIFMVILLSYLFSLSYGEIVKHGNNFKRFDPYEILEIEPGVDVTTIKKAYRKLTLKYHPDKNPNNLQAKAKFIMIAKAYESLTDEVARKNFEMYGNPDGPGSMRLAVGLPSFVLNKKNHMPILLLFLILIVIIIPAFVWFWFKNSNKYDESGMIVEDQKIFFEFLNENILPRQMPFVLGAALEYSNLKIRQEEAEELNKLWKQFKDQMPKHKEEIIPFSNRKAICLIYAYINNHQFSTEGLKEDLNVILKSAPTLIHNMYQMAIYFTNYKMIDRNFQKNFGYNCIKTILEFSQTLHQKIPFGRDANPFLQFPHFTDLKYKNLKRPVSGTDLRLTSSLPAFVNLTPEDRRFILKSEFLDSEIEDIEKSIENIPRYSFKVETFVEGFGEEILLEDLMTIKVTLVRENLEEGKVNFLN